MQKEQKWGQIFHCMQGKCYKNTKDNEYILINIYTISFLHPQPPTQIYDCVSNWSFDLVLPTTL